MSAEAPGAGDCTPPGKLRSTILDICLALKRLAQAYQDEIVIVYRFTSIPTFMYRSTRRYLVSITSTCCRPWITCPGPPDETRHPDPDRFGRHPGRSTVVCCSPLVLRQRTERQEGVQAGTLKLVGTDPDTIFMEALKLLDDRAAHAAMSGAVNPYGDGHAAERIVAALLASQTG